MSKEPRVIGLDIGTHRIVVAEQVAGDIQFRSQLNAFLKIPYSSMTKRVLQKEAVPYTTDGNEFTVFGDSSEDFANLLNVETRRPMLGGVLNAGEPEGLRSMRALLENLIGPAKEPCKASFSTPAPPLSEPDGVSYHTSVIRQILTDMGYTPTHLNEGLAVIYSELEESNYTGIGVSCGGGMCNICLAYLSVPVVSFSTTKAGDFVDSSAAAATGEVATRVRIAKEQSFELNGSSTDRVHQALAVYYEAMIENLVATMNDAFTSARNLPRLRKPIPLALSGGSAMPKGFADKFEAALRKSGFPIPVSGVQLAAKPLYATARGTLMAGLADQEQ
jgi:hypothetical protein